MSEQLELPFYPVPVGEIRNMARRLMISDGLLPIVGAKEGQIDEALGKLPPELRRATTRRFRKAWRLALRDSQNRSGSPTEPLVQPSTAEKRNRVVSWYIQRAKSMVECGSHD